jgi:regulatory protein NPR1
MNRLEEQPLKSLSQDFLNLFLNGQSFSDVSFAVEGRHVYAHKCVLAARSPFFRMIFCGDVHMLDGAPAVVGSTTQQQQPQPPRAAAAAIATVAPQVIPVGIVGHDVFMLLLQFLYTGNLCFSPQNLSRACKEKSCWHTHCSSAVEFALETLNAAHFFGVDQLSTLTQVILLFLSLLLLLIAFEMLQTSVLQHLLCLLLELDILQTSVNISSMSVS